MLRGVRGEEVDERKRRNELEYRELEMRDREDQVKKRGEKIRESQYNKWYEEIRVEGISGYLTRGWFEERWRKVLRFRVGNKMRETRYWEDREGRLCRICG